MMNRRQFTGSLALGLGVVAVGNPLEWLERQSQEFTKIELIRQLLKNGLEAHDKLLETAFSQS